MKNKFTFFFKTIGILAIINALYSLRYLFLGVNGIVYLNDNDIILSFLSQQKTDFWHQFVLSQQTLYQEAELSVLIHIIGVSIALIIGVFQFIPSLRIKAIFTHKFFGFVYLFSTLIGLFLGVFISFDLPMVGGKSSIIMNIIGGTLGIIFVLMATIRLWQKKYLDHGKWMLRSYAVLLTIVTLYLLIGFFAICRLPIELGYELAHLFCLPINLIIVEIIIRKKINIFIINEQNK